MNESNDKPICGWMRLHHPSGCLVTLPVGVMGFNFHDAFASVNAALTAGFLIAPPGLEAGEEKSLCGWVVRSQKDGRTGTAEVLDLYLPDDIYSKVRVYLNTPEEIGAFEFASKLKVAALPLYIGAGKIERGKDKRVDTLVVKVPRPFAFVWHDNPSWSQEDADAATARKEVYSVPKRKWLRWADQEKDAELVKREEEPKQLPEGKQRPDPGAATSAAVAKPIPSTTAATTAPADPYAKERAYFRTMPTQAEGARLWQLWDERPDALALKKALQPDKEEMKVKWQAQTAGMPTS